MAAEILLDASQRRDRDVRFNEAAANGRGNRKIVQGRVAEARASMRPRRMAAEIDRGSQVGWSGYQASMRPRRMAAEIIVEPARNPPLG